MKFTKFQIQSKKIRASFYMFNSCSYTWTSKLNQKKKLTEPLKVVREAFILIPTLDVALEFNTLEVSCPEVRTGTVIYGE